MSSAGFDISSLSEEQQLALQQYTSVTDQDLAAAVPLLQKCQWNVQIAITRFFDGDAETIDPAAEAARMPPPANDRRAETLMNSIPARSSARAARGAGLEAAPRVVPTPENQLVQPVPFPFNIILLPFNLTYVIFQRIFGTLGYLFPILPRLFARFWSGRASRPTRDTGRKALSSKDTVARFVRELEEEYGSVAGTLPFYQGSYANAFDTTSRDLKFLLVVFLSPEHDDTAPFVRQTLLAPEFVEFVQKPENNIVLWAGSVQDAEPYQVAGALHVTRFPYTCLIVHTPSTGSTAMSKIAAISGLSTAQELINKFHTAMNTQAAELDRVRRQRAEQAATRNLRQEQESAYERSLAQDREKARRRKEEEAARAKEEKEEQEKTRRRDEEARNLAQWRRWRSQSLPAEPDAAVKDAVRVSIRLQNGERLTRRFQPDADLEELYAFVECHEMLIDTLAEKHVDEPASYDHVYQFRLVSPMPREVYDLEKGGSLRSRIGRSGNLIVESLVDEEEAEDGDDDDE
ncbi:hypothetical protein AMS68_001675 [Peltaster fructicola]|uniref:UBX domain-containing protein n=1 Tax=Peltaster fructicola TaxID=286661 RepID=A0A6H0XNG3_9PEZI|nr:hypothetical protein AMS68_001675 [Peltaster fructicola]